MMPGATQSHPTILEQPVKEPIHARMEEQKDLKNLIISLNH